MSIDALSAGKHLGVLSGWSKTNLELQKILYIAHMIHLGIDKKPLVRDHFQAWLFGPVHPVLYYKAKIFGAKPVRNIFRSIEDLDEKQSEAITLNRIFGLVSEFSGAKLVAVTHCSYGAWAKNYRPDAMGIIIPNEDILKEFEERKERFS